MLLVRRCDHTWSSPAEGAIAQTSNANVCRTEKSTGDWWAGYLFYNGVFFSHMEIFNCNAKKYLASFQVELLCTQCQIKWLKSLVFTVSSQWRNSQICVPWSCLGGACSERDVTGQHSFHSSFSDSCHVGVTETSVHYKHPADDLCYFSACCSR